MSQGLGVGRGRPGRIRLLRRVWHFQLPHLSLTSPMERHVKVSCPGLTPPSTAPLNVPDVLTVLEVSVRQSESTRQRCTTQINLTSTCPQCSGNNRDTYAMMPFGNVSSLQHVRWPVPCSTYGTLGGRHRIETEANRICNGSHGRHAAELTPSLQIVGVPQLSSGLRISGT